MLPAILIKKANIWFNTLFRKCIWIAKTFEGIRISIRLILQIKRSSQNSTLASSSSVLTLGKSLGNTRLTGFLTIHGLCLGLLAVDSEKDFPRWRHKPYVVLFHRHYILCHLNLIRESLDIQTRNWHVILQQNY